MIDIPKYKNWAKVEPLNKGWSSDKKYYIETVDGKRLLLRISDISEYEKKKAEFEAVKTISKLDIPMSLPIDFGVCGGGTKVYILLAWIDGEDAEKVLPTLSEKEQYELGVEAGRLLRKIHSLPAPEWQKPWSKRFNKKIDRKIEEYNKHGLKLPDDDKIFQYIEQNRQLLNGRPQCMHHGDYHVGNIIIMPDRRIGTIDFNRWDYGDPWEEFNRIVWCINTSKHFACGRIDGYFNNDVPDEFFRLMALYIACNQISSIYWAIPFGQGEIDTMMNQAARMLDYYEGFKRIVPKWYEGNKT